MLEKLFQKKWNERRELYSFILGLIIPIIAGTASFLVFKSLPYFIGVGTLMFCVILAMPTINKLFDTEEEKEIHSKSNFFKKHNHIIDSFLYFFLGTFISFLLIGMLFPGVVFKTQDFGASEISEENMVFPDATELVVQKTAMDSVKEVFLSNTTVLIVCFLLSLVFGAGSIFLIIMNSSVFAWQFREIIIYSGFSGLGKIGYIICNLGILKVHGIPEVLAYLVAAIGGGVLSQAIIKEKFWSECFKIVLKDSLILFGISILILIVSAFLEIFVAKNLYASEFCMSKSYIWIIPEVVIIGGILTFEILRQKHKRRKK